VGSIKGWLATIHLHCTLLVIAPFKAPHRPSAVAKTLHTTQHDSSYGCACMQISPATARKQRDQPASGNSAR
jgi:hypothetical protein